MRFKQVISAMFKKNKSCGLMSSSLIHDWDSENESEDLLEMLKKNELKKNSGDQQELIDKVDKVNKLDQLEVKKYSTSASLEEIIDRIEEPVRPKSIKVVEPKIEEGNIKAYNLQSIEEIVSSSIEKKMGDLKMDTIEIQMKELREEMRDYKELMKNGMEDMKRHTNSIQLVINDANEISKHTRETFKMAERTMQDLIEFKNNLSQSASAVEYACKTTQNVLADSFKRSDKVNLSIVNGLEAIEAIKLNFQENIMDQKHILAKYKSDWITARSELTSLLKEQEKKLNRERDIALELEQKKQLSLNALDREMKTRENDLKVKEEQLWMQKLELEQLRDQILKIKRETDSDKRSIVIEKNELKTEKEIIEIDKSQNIQILREITEQRDFTTKERKRLTEWSVRNESIEHDLKAQLADIESEKGVLQDLKNEIGHSTILNTRRRSRHKSDILTKKRLSLYKLERQNDLVQDKLNKY